MSIDNNDTSKHNQGHSSLKHMLHMILCCGLPVVIILALPTIAGISPAFAGILGIIAPFICPVMMGGMLFMMFRKNKSGCCDEPKSGNNEIQSK